MSRYFMIQSWVGSHENEPDYNGQQCGERNVRSSEVVPLYDQYGNANVSAFSDEAIAARTGSSVKPKSSVSIQYKILPQLRTLNKRIAEIIELENEYKAGNLSIQDYTVLRSVAFQKRDRAEVLYKKAINTAKSRNESAVDSVETDTQNNDQPLPAHREEIVTGTFLDELSCDNFAKYPLQKALQISRVLVRWAIKTKHYINELKRV